MTPTAYAMTFPADPSRSSSAEDGRSFARLGRTGARRAAIVGTGLIGGSIGMALRAQGWHVSGRDVDSKSAARALELGALDTLGGDPSAEVTFVATPVGQIVGEVRAVLAQRGLRSDAVVTDVGSVKLPVISEIADPRFIGGHPMAGSEQLGVDGSDPSLFVGATWVLTPGAATAPDTYALLQSVVTSLGAEAVALHAAEHDSLVAVVSHVPHLTAATLMNLATASAEHQGSLMRLAAGGFRDMTRVAAGHPGIWPDICTENSVAIVSTLDSLVENLRSMRDLVARGNRQGLLDALQSAAEARRALPDGAVRPEHLSEMRVPVPDRPGVLAEITTLAGNLGVNIADVEIAHSVEGDRGVLVLVVDTHDAHRLGSELAGHGYQFTTMSLT
ncbi:MAG: prephenate dehydrogenase/arogenate dehydrogenase family protein [Acidimicrobiales bacterium]